VEILDSPGGPQVLPLLEIRQLRCFLAVARELHFRRAADTLHVSQPTLTRHIKQLEYELGVELFRRNKRHVALTSPGSALREEANAVIERLERAVMLARGARAADVPEFYLGYSTLLDLSFLRRIRTAAAQLAVSRDISVRLQSAAPRDLLAQLLDGSIRACLVEMPFEDDAIECRWVMDESLVLAMPAAHPLARQKLIEPHRLRAQRMIWITRSMAPQHSRFLASACERAGFWPQIVEEVSTAAECLDLVAQGAGVAFARSSLPRVAGVVYRPIAGDPFRMQTGLAALTCPHSLHQSKLEFSAHHNSFSASLRPHISCL
jgi:DNA-binding transcriptional LysR family regulator